MLNSLIILRPTPVGFERQQRVAVSIDPSSRAEPRPIDKGWGLRQSGELVVNFIRNRNGSCPMAKTATAV
jgi:hypothetical protein